MGNYGFAMYLDVRIAYRGQRLLYQDLSLLRSQGLRTGCMVYGQSTNSEFPLISLCMVMHGIPLNSAWNTLRLPVDPRLGAVFELQGHRDDEFAS